MKKAFAFFSISFALASAAFICAEVKAEDSFSSENSYSFQIAANAKKISNVNQVDDVEFESEDSEAAPEMKAGHESDPDAVEQSEDVEEYKGDIESLKNPDDAQQHSSKEDDGGAPPSEDPDADAKYQVALQECEKKAEEGGDFNESLRKCMNEKGLAQDLNDAENNVF